MLLSKANKIFHKIMTNNRKSHILKILETYDEEHYEYGRNIPIDFHIRKYYLQNKQVCSIDREFINDQVYTMVKYKGLLDFLTPSPLNWKSRFDTIYDSDFEKQMDNKNLPPHVRVSYPKELFDLIVNSFGIEKAIEYCKVMNGRAPLTVRTNILKISRDDLIYSFKKRGFDVYKTEHSPYGITFNTNPRANFFALEEFRKGFFEVQDEGSQLVALRVDCKPGDIIVDYCGGSGGKTLAFAPFTQGKGQIFLHDIRKNVLIEARKRLRRAGIQNYQLNNDKNNLGQLLKNKCDWVLLDVPCSGSGTLKRNPDLKWKFSIEKLEETLQVQEQILVESLDLIKPNGKIVYVTCSLLQEENISQIFKFCKKYGMKIQNDVIFQTVPKPKKMDGFFSVTLVKK